MPVGPDTVAARRLLRRLRARALTDHTYAVREWLARQAEETP